MNTITYEDNERFNSIRDQGKAYSGGEYDFTFDDRFIVYHITCGADLRYIVLDTDTFFGSEVMCVSADKKLGHDDYENISRDVARSLRYTGILKYLGR